MRDLGRRLTSTCLGALACLGGQAQVPSDQGSVLLEVPIMVQAPGHQSIVRGYHDGERFLVDAADLFDRLGYAVTRQGMVLVSADADRQFSVDFALEEVVRPDAETVSVKGEVFFLDTRYLVSTTALSRLFGTDVHFDQARLSLMLSTGAEHFNTFALGSRSVLGSEVPGPVHYGRERHLLGGAVASWHVQWQRHRHKPAYRSGNVHFSTSMLGGSVRGVVGSTIAGTYLFDRPHSRYLTHVEVGRMVSGRTRPMDAVRLSNLPLASPILQRTATVHGAAPPHALAEAVAGGQVVDRVQVGPDGRYRLRVPAYYGSTEAIVRVRPLGGVAPFETRHYLLTTPELAPPGHWYYDAVLAPRGGLRVRYGVRPRLSVRVSGQHRGAVQAGMVASPLPFMVVSADVALPWRLVQASAHLWRSHVNATASFTSQGGATRGHAIVSGQWRRVGMQFSGSASCASDGWTAVHLVPSASIHARGVAARVQVQSMHYGGIHTSAWHAWVSKSRPVWGGTLQVGLTAHGMRSLHAGGTEVLLTTRRMAVGAAVTYDPARRELSAKASLQVRADFLGFTSRAHTSGVHTHTAFGSISVGPELRLTRALRDESAALLRIFEDLNGDGVLNAGEPMLPDVEAQLYHAPLVRVATGALRAMYLEPYAAYQVRILEQSVRDPWLRPVPGYFFSFIADPGRTKVVDIPLQRVPLVRGRVESPQRPVARLRVRAFRDGAATVAADVYRDGGFALRLPPGTYRLLLEDVVSEVALLEQSLVVPPGTRTMEVTLTPN